MAISRLDNQHWVLLGTGVMGLVGALAGKNFRMGSLGGTPISASVGRAGFFILGLLLIIVSLYAP